LKRSQYLINKLKWAIITIMVVIVFNFFLFRILPGDPARTGMRDPRLSAASQTAIRVRFGLDKPVINCFQSLSPPKLGSCLVNPLDTQFFLYIINLFHGDFGDSYSYNVPVADILGPRLLNTVILMFIGNLIAVVFGMLLGVVAAWRSHTKLDAATVILSLITWALPTFWLGIILLIWGSRLGLPLNGMWTPGASYANFAEKMLDLGRHLLMPTITIVIVIIGEYVIIMRSTLLDVFSEDYVLTAKAKGLSTFQIIKDHAMQNAMLPMVTIIAMNLGFIVAGAIQIETVFSYPGIGLLVFEAVGKRDYPLLQGGFFIIAVSVILANLIADLLYSYLDPRVEAS
jgi:peptide/nickel transport system permease protein